MPTLIHLILSNVNSLIYYSVQIISNFSLLVQQHFRLWHRKVHTEDTLRFAPDGQRVSHSTHELFDWIGQKICYHLFWKWYTSMGWQCYHWQECVCFPTSNKSKCKSVLFPLSWCNIIFQNFDFKWLCRLLKEPKRKSQQLRIFKKMWPVKYKIH